MEINDVLYYNEIDNINKYLDELVLKLNNDVKNYKKEINDLLDYYNPEKLKVNFLSGYLYVYTKQEVLINTYIKMHDFKNKIDNVINKLENINVNNINSIYQDIKDIVGVTYISADIFSTNDFVDIVYFFNNSKIVKIIDGERIIEIDDALPKNMYFIYFADQAPSIKEIMSKFNEYKIKYNITDVDNIICQYFVKNKLFIILTT